MKIFLRADCINGIVQVEKADIGDENILSAEHFRSCLDSLASDSIIYGEIDDTNTLREIDIEYTIR